MCVFPSMTCGLALSRKAGMVGFLLFFCFFHKTIPISSLTSAVDRHQGVCGYVLFTIHHLALIHTDRAQGTNTSTARNNLKAMNAGDMAFFYHSNCKTPGIVGTMEIVREFSEDSTQTTTLPMNPVPALPASSSIADMFETNRECSPTRHALLRSQVNQGQPALEPRPRRVSPQVRRAHLPAGAARAGKTRRTAGRDADAEAVPDQCQQGRRQRMGGAVQARR